MMTATFVTFLILQVASSSTSTIAIVMVIITK